MQIHVILQVQLEVALQHLRRSQAAAAQAASEWHSAGGRGPPGGSHGASQWPAA
jgi:hypothetical protein